MKLFAALLIATLFLALATPFTFAQSTATTSSKLEQRKANIQQKIEDRKEKVASRSAALRAKFKSFKDQKKAEIADRVETNLNKVNQNRTAEMARNLNKMSDILGRLSSKSTDPSISSASAAIVTAKTAVTAQSQKTYEISVKSEGKVKTDALTVRTQLATDLKAVHQQVVTARQAVANAIKITNQSRGDK